jgi:hypothetical protein
MQMHHAMHKNVIAVHQKRCRLEPAILPRRTIVKKTTLSIAAVAAALITASSAGFAAELPTYELAGFPISPVQAQVLGVANVHEQVPSSAVSPHQLNAPAPRKKVATATGIPAQTTTGSALR